MDFIFHISSSGIYNQDETMIQTKDNMRSFSHGVRLLGVLSREGRSIFTTPEAREIAAAAGVPEDYVNNLLGRLVREGWLLRLRRGLFAKFGTGPGDFQVHPFAIATHLIIPSAISHWSALNHHGLTEQIPRVVTAFTPKKVVTPSMRAVHKSVRPGRHAWEIEGVRCEYVTVKKEHFFGIEKVWMDENTKVQITDRERTVLEVFISSRLFGGVSEALGIIESHLSTLDIDKLVEYARRFGKIATAKRLGWALESAGVPDSALEPLLDIPAIGYHALDPARARLGPCNRKWMIQDNLLGRKKT